MQRIWINLISQNADYIGVPISQDNIVDYSIFASFKGLSLPIFLEQIYL